ncbi:hypothetical protein GN244_ATG13224 [Phytophthora infestans]|uniref:Uncharacterized protein n=1 Tax=Phytophthora infestans TaxID=4787 RepID=A0A833SI24_PHYIN|nr:hypothetical protein GN244_ATG13224 [Phytophthora infestans]
MSAQRHQWWAALQAALRQEKSRSVAPGFPEQHLVVTWFDKDGARSPIVDAKDEKGKSNSNAKGKDTQKTPVPTEKRLSTNVSVDACSTMHMD